MNIESIRKALENFGHQQVMIIGDVILDAYFNGKVNRVSPEAPVSVLDIDSKEYRLGGAANVALNIKKLGAEALIYSVIGNDEAGEKLEALLKKEHISSAGLVKSTMRMTSVKTRLVSGHHQLLRMDEEQCDNLDQTLESTLLDRIRYAINNDRISVIIFQDYDKGCLTPSLIDSVMEMATKRGIPTAVDPKKRNFLSYSGATLFKPNLRELKEGLLLAHLETSSSALKYAFQQLNDVMPTQMALFTLSSDGVYITDGENGFHFPAHVRQISDVSGAGDTVISVAACALAAGMGIEEIAAVSNLAGGWVCQYPGVVPIAIEQLQSEIDYLNR